MRHRPSSTRRRRSAMRGANAKRRDFHCAPIADRYPAGAIEQRCAARKCKVRARWIRPNCNTVDPRSDRSRGRPRQICAGAGAVARRDRRRHRALRHRPLQSRGRQQTEPCRRNACRRAFRHPGNGAADHRDRRQTNADCTFSVDIVHGGQWVNCVASRCTGLEQPAASRQCGRALCRKPEALAAQAGLAQYLLPEISEIA